jgi:GT2 family glycosyltransferase
MKIGFVVLTYNRSDALLAVLHALAVQCPGDAVVVIADDGSNPEHIEVLRRGLPPFACRVLHAWQPDVGFTAARSRNIGALHAQADYLVFLDGDCVPGTHFVRNHLGLARPSHFVNGSRVLLSERLTAEVLRGDVDLSSLGFGDWLRLRWTGDINRLSHLLSWPGAPGRVETRFRWKSIRSCNFALWYPDLAAVNGFDESFSGWGHEDADLVLRLHHQGLSRINGYFGTEVYHLWHRENTRDNEQANRQRVLDRMHGASSVRAERGLAEAMDAKDVIVTELNP